MLALKQVAIMGISILLSSGFISPTYSKGGCIKGALVGAIAGHFAGHGLLGAAAGCAIAHHAQSKKNNYSPSQNLNPNTYPSQYNQFNQPQKGLSYH